MFYNAVFFEIGDDSGYPFIDSEFVGFDDELRVLRFLIGSRDAGELRDLPCPRLLVVPFGIPVFADIQRAFTEYLYERPVLCEVPGILPVCPVRGYECRHIDDACLPEEVGHLADPPDVLLAILRGEAEIFVQAVPNVVSVQNIGDVAPFEKSLFHLCCQGRFA